ncbi:MAG: lanthionine synthetase LanC family protein [Planctomycetota bacterium]
MILLIFTCVLWTGSPGGESRPYLEAANEALRWLRSCALPQKVGKAWPVDPRQPGSLSTNLYDGVPGVVLFFLDASRLTGDKRYLADAREGADWLVSQVEAISLKAPAADAARVEGEGEMVACGLYEGLAGTGFVLDKVFAACGEEKYRKAAIHCLDVISHRAKEAGSGVEWEDVTDIIRGSAGTGLFLLYAARDMGRGDALELARRVGARLLERGIPEAGGTKWPMSATYPRLMPNFSHGAAGVSYFLAELGGAAGERAFLDAAVSGATYLQAVARTEDEGCLIFHHEPGGEDLYYLGWCHGPVGTSRLFLLLGRLAEPEEWMEWVQRGAHSVLKSGIPEKPTPGFWNNVGQCCGSAGVVEFFLNLYLLEKEPEYLRFAKHMADTLIKYATRDEKGWRWPQAEHRVRPEELIAQTGYMQGAAGIGMCLLHLDAVEQWERVEQGAAEVGRAATRPDWLRLPDDPFGK